jgi:hypothetical protein
MLPSSSIRGVAYACLCDDILQRVNYGDMACTLMCAMSQSLDE